jgi:hypothetical protein
MDQAPHASEVIDDRAMRRPEPAMRGQLHGSRSARAVSELSSGLHGVALPSALQPPRRSARARLAAPLPGAGGAPELNPIHYEGPGEDDDVPAC